MSRRLSISRSSRRIKTYLYFTQTVTKAEHKETSISEFNHLTVAMSLEDIAPHVEQEPKPPAQIVRRPEVPVASETLETHTRSRCPLLTIPLEILDEILKWLSINDQQSVAWTSKVLYQNYVPILQDSRQEFHPETEEYRLLQRRPQRKKSEIPCCPLEERIQGSEIDLWRVQHTESCTGRYTKSVRLCPCMVICPRRFEHITYDLGQKRGIILAADTGVGLVMEHTKHGPYIVHECTITSVPNLGAHVTVHIASLSDERLLVSTEYQIRFWDMTSPDKAEPLHICPHEQDIIPWLRAYFDRREKRIVRWQSAYELCPSCHIMVCRGKEVFGIVVRVRSGIYQDRHDGQGYCRRFEIFPVRPFAVAANYQDYDCDASSQRTEQQLENWGGTALC